MRDARGEQRELAIGGLLALVERLVVRAVAGLLVVAHGGRDLAGHLVALREVEHRADRARILAKRQLELRAGIGALAVAEEPAALVEQAVGLGLVLVAGLRARGCGQCNQDADPAHPDKANISRPVTGVE